MHQLVETRAPQDQKPQAVSTAAFLPMSLPPVIAETLTTLEQTKSQMERNESHVLCRTFGQRDGLRLVDLILHVVSWQSGAIPLIEMKKTRQLGYAQSAVGSRVNQARNLVKTVSTEIPELRRFRNLTMGALSVLERCTKVSLNGVDVTPEIIKRAIAKLAKGTQGIAKALKCLETPLTIRNSEPALTPPVDLKTKLQKLDFVLNRDAALATLRVEFSKLATTGQEAEILNLIPLNDYTAYWGPKFLKRQTLLELLLKSEPPLATAKGIDSLITSVSDGSEPPLNLEDLPNLALNAKNPAVRFHAIRAIDDSRTLIRTLGELSKSKHSAIRKPMGPWHYMAEYESLIKISFLVFTNLPSVLRVLPRLAFNRLWIKFTGGDEMSRQERRPFSH